MMQPPVAGGQLDDARRVDRRSVSGPERTARKQRIEVGAILRVETNDLELGHQQFRRRQCRIRQSQSVCERQRVAHLERVDEHVDVCVAVRIVE